MQTVLLWDDIQPTAQRFHIRGKESFGVAEVLVQVYFKILVIAIVNLHDSLCEEWGSHAHQAALWRCGGPDIHLRSRWVPRKPPSNLGDLPRVTSSHRININSQKRGCWVTCTLLSAC